MSNYETREILLTTKINELIEKMEQLRKPTADELRLLQDEKTRLIRMRAIARKRHEKKIQKSVAIKN